MSGGKGSDSPDEVTQKTEPWGPLQPFLIGQGGQGGGGGTINIPGIGEVPSFGGMGGGTTGVLPEAERLYTEGPSMFAPLDPLQRQGQEQQLNYAQDLGGFIGDYQGAAQFGLNAPDVTQNPYLEGAMEAAARPLTRNLTENILPNIRRNFTGAGQYGSSRQGIAEGLAAGRTQEAIADQTAQMGSEAYGQGLQQQARTMTLMPQVMQSGAIPGDIMSSIGAQRRAVGQAEQMEPFERLNYYRSILAGTPSGQETTQPVFNQGGGLMSGLGGAATGAGLAQSLSLSNPATAGLAALGGLAGLFG